MLQITRYHKTRFWALWDGSELVAVVVYKKGAAELLRRLAAQAGRRRDQRERPRGLRLRGSRAATNGSATEAASPHPFFRPGGRHTSAARRALSRLARVFFACHP
jgi:hypothetical protein